MEPSSVGQNMSLFRPSPPSVLQSNLAEYYQRTSEFVKEQFGELKRPSVQESERNGATTFTDDSNEENTPPRIKPLGLGANFDIYA
jgi:hypothetical protein